MRFTPNDIQQCATISIIDDTLIEQEEESFYVSLQLTDNTPERVNLILPSAEVTIIDNDGRFCGLEKGIQ